MPCGSASSLDSSKRSSRYCTVWITCSPILKSQNPSRATLVRYSLYYTSWTYFDKQYPCVTPLSVSTLLVSPRSSHTLTLWSIYSLLMNLLSYQSIPFSFRICINLVQFTRSKASTQFFIYVQSLFWHYSQHPNCILSSFSSSKSKLILSK